MTALGGVVGATVELPRLCSAILTAQRRYGDGVADIATVPGAVVGATCDGASASQHGRWLLVADSRLDNRDELIDALGLSGRSRTDAAILLEAWLRWGDNSLQRLLGDFAIAVYDGERRMLTLARDPTGQRPLFYKRAAGATAFASMPSGLARMFAANGPNLALLARSLSNLLHDDRQSYFEGIKRVLPGEVVELSEDSIRSGLYWQPKVEHRSRAGSQDYVRSYRDLLDSAVECRLQGRPLPIGCHLSSGFDSSAVTATAARLVDRPGDLVAFTSAPLEGADQNLIRHRFADESPIAAQTARMHGLRHVIVRETAPLFDVIERQTLLSQSPQLSPFNMVWLGEIRRQAKAMGIGTILTGEIGNLTLNSSGLRTLAFLVGSGKLRRWWKEARLAVRRSDMRWRGVLINSFAPWLPTRAWRGLTQIFVDRPTAGELDFLRPHWSEKLRGEYPLGQPSSNPYLDRLRLIRLFDPGPNRMAAEAEGIEEIDPLSDRRLAEFSLRLPADQLFRDGQPRPLARAALGDRLPKAVLDLQVRGMQGIDWHLRISQRSAREALETIAPNAAVQELLDLPRLQSAIDQWPTGDWNSYRTFLKYRDRVTGALATGIFLTRFEAICDGG